MKRFTLSTVLIASSLTLAYAALQNPLVFEDLKKNIHIEGRDGFYVPNESFELKGKVIMKQVSEKLTMTCEKATGKLIRANGKVEFDDVQLTGGVHVSQVGETSSFAGNSTKATYDYKENLRTVNLVGNVVIDFSGTSVEKAQTAGKPPVQKASTLNVLASSANVVFKKIVTGSKKDGVEVQSAVISGPITFNGNQTSKIDNQTKRQKFSAKADKMTYSILESGRAEVRLTGNLEINQEDQSGEGAQISGARTIILELDRATNDIVRIKFSSEGVGQVRSEYSSGKGGN